MIIASGPYISPHFADTASRNRWPVLDAGGGAEFGLATTRDLVGAAGQARMITADMVKPGAVVIDVGINRTEDGLVGDVDVGHALPDQALLPRVHEIYENGRLAAYAGP